MDKVVERAVFLDLDEKALKKTFIAQPEAIRFIIPTKGGQQMVINAVRNHILTDDFKLITQDGEYIDYIPGHFYRGTVENAPHSLAAISIFPDEIIAVFSTKERGDISLGEMQIDTKAKQAPYVLIEEKSFLINEEFFCMTPEPTAHELQNARFGATANSNPIFDANNCIKWYFECRFEFYQANGSSVAQATNTITGMYNVVEAIYANESIITQIDQVFIWTELDPYSNSLSTGLSQFVDARNPIPGDANVAHLISSSASGAGGIANGIGGFCGDRPLSGGVNGTTGHSHSTVSNAFNPYPNYSRTVKVLAHENGHNLGSFHTHGCYWGGNYPNGGETVDDCGTVDGSTEGSACFDPNNPKLPQQGGTIMSYCDRTGLPGVNFNEGFGPEPGFVIRDYAYNGPCAPPCGDANCPTVNGIITNIDCNGNNNGSIDLSVSGGTPPYTFTWSNGATTEDVNGLAAGSYGVTVGDASGECNITRSFGITEPEAIGISGVVTPEDSPNSGEIDLTVTGGSNPYGFLWSNGATTEDIFGLSSGEYTVSVTDDNDCEAIETFFVPGNVGCNATINEFPYLENFETGTLGVFGQGIK